MDDNLLESGPLVEGLDDAVTFSLVIAALIIFTSVIFLYWPRRRQAQIHPSFIFAVNDIRQERLQSEPLASSIENEESSRSFADPDRVCPICLGSASFAVLTNCGHLFCCICFDAESCPW